MTDLGHQLLLLLGRLCVVDMSITPYARARSVLVIGNSPKVNDELELDLAEDYGLKCAQVFFLLRVRIDSEYT